MQLWVQFSQKLTRLILELVKIRIKMKYSIWILYFFGAVLVPVAVGVGLLYPNVILEQGLAHRIFYIHVSVAWVALYGPILASIFGIIYIIKPNSVWDRHSYTSNILSILFSVGVLISGPIWAYSAWGVSWDWTDARLQSFFILVISLMGYFFIRSMIIDPDKKALYSSYLSILCALNAIATWGAIRWIDNPGNHPSTVLGKGGMDPDMKIAFYLNVFAFHIFFWLLYRITLEYQKIKTEFELNRSEIL
jgi:heme exporter protein C